MRQLTSGLSLGFALLVCAGCTPNKPFLDRNPRTTATTAATPTVAQLVKYLNASADRVQAMRCDRVAIDCQQEGKSVGLDGVLVCQKPRDFRLRLKLAGTEAADLGSNNDEFWYWISRAEPPYVYHCSYEALRKNNVHLPFPFQPETIMTALGISHYNENGDYRLNAPPRAHYYELIERTTTPQGQPLEKVTVFNRDPVNPMKGEPQVIAYVLRTGNTIICKAQVQEVVVQNYAILPKKVKLEWPQQKAEMTIDLWNLKVMDRFPADKAATYFSRSGLAAKPFDLASRSVDAPVQQAGGYAPGR